MSMLFLEGWDLYNTSSNVVTGNWDTIGGTPVISTTGGKLNGHHVVMNAASDLTRFDLLTISNPSDFYMGFHFKVDSLATNVIIQWFDSTDTQSLHTHLRLLASGALQVRGDDVINTVHGTTAGGLIGAGTWYTIELRFRPSSFASANGSFTLHIDGTERINISNVQFDPFLTGTASRYALGEVQLQGATSVHRFDDVYMFIGSGNLNTTFAGDFHIQTLRPASDTATASWTAVNAGAHYEEVDDATADGDATYVSSQEVNAADVYELTDLTGDVGSILGYGPIFLGRREIGSTRTVGVRLIGSSETVNFSGHSLSTDYEYRSNLRSASVDDPTQTTYPDEAEVNALQAGVYIP